MSTGVYVCHKRTTNGSRSSVNVFRLLKIKRLIEFCSLFWKLGFSGKWCSKTSHWYALARSLIFVMAFGWWGPRREGELGLAIRFRSIMGEKTNGMIYGVSSLWL